MAFGITVATDFSTLRSSFTYHQHICLKHRVTSLHPVALRSAQLSPSKLHDTPTLNMSPSERSGKQARASTTATSPLSDPFPSDGVLYFSYGSNMCRKKLQSRGDQSTPPIAFISAQPARLPNWSLCFDMQGAPPAEPAMGSIRQEDGDEVYGMVYHITDEASWRKLLLTEGVSTSPVTDSYQVINVNIECFSPDAPEKRVTKSAKTLMTNPNMAIAAAIEVDVRPSRRYVNLLIEGAVTEGLPKAYVERLRGITVARKWSRSPLLFLMTMAIPALFIVRKLHVRFLTFPLTRYGMVLYARHERIMRHDKLRTVQKVQLWALRLLLFLLYGAYFVPLLILFAVSPKARRFYSVLVKMFNAAEDENVAEEDKARKVREAAQAKAANDAINSFSEVTR